ncbi:hypothetical protein FSW04_17655 [Baekduia soli]|uniref:Uncharacterized protein n=1 Tax=Baekduia soli TaxID=496014 RepID=A0A5B8U829_9ACTN|nr:hypothetical protein [Baekduia soli]QEC49224.1 hypothetical protein FSW04_17655 [Baekduia soli]
MRGIETGGGAGKATPKLRRPAKPAVVKPPKGDVASSGADYGMRQAKPVVDREVKQIRRRQTEAKDTKGNTDRNRAVAYKRTQAYLNDVQAASDGRQAPTNGQLDLSNRKTVFVPIDKTIVDRPRSDAEMRRFLETGQRPVKVGTRIQQAAIQAKVVAPAVKVLDTVARPSHGIAGAADAIAQGKGVGSAHHALTRGLEGKDKTTFSTVLQHLGVHNKALRTVGGFALDVGTDPTTYLTAGTGAPLRKVAADGLERELNKGLQIGLRGHIPLTDIGGEIKTSGRATSYLMRKTGASKVATKVRESGPVQGVGKAIIHDFRPKTRTPEQHAAFREAEARHRAGTHVAAQAIERRYGHALPKAIQQPEDYQSVIDAIEAGTVDELPVRLQHVATTISGDLSRMHSDAAARDLTGPARENYVPHVHKDMVGPAGKSKGGGRVTVAPEHARKIDKTLAELRAEGNSPFTEDLPRIVAKKANKEAARASLHDFWQSVANHARPVEPHQELHLHDGDMVYKVNPDGLEAVGKTDVRGDLKPDKAEIARVVGGERPGRYVVLHLADVHDLTQRLRGGAAAEGPARIYDKAQGALKTAYTVPNPAYHLRNLYGDSLNAFLGDTSAHSFRQAAQILETRAVRNRAERSAEHFTGGATAPKRLTKNIKIGDKTYTHGELLAEAEAHGAVGQGFIGRELTDLTGKAGPIQRASQYREDLPRLATYLSARKRGLSPAQAADWVAKHHFDYGDVTPFERAFARRVIPFYTFFARNTRLQAMKILTRPGKAATFSKVLTTAAQAAGFGSYDEYASQLKDYEQRGLPIPIRWNGKVYNLFAAPPQTDLNQLSPSAQDQWQNIANRVTFFKTVGEILENHSIFFQGQIQDPQHPYTRAPDAIAVLAETVPGLAKKLGVTHDWIDPNTGHKAWAWYAKTDYAVRSLPEGNFAIQQLLPDRGTRNQTSAQARLAFATGIKATPYKTDARALSTVKTELRDVGIELAHMRDFGQAEDPKHHGQYAPAYQALLDKQHKLAGQRDRLEASVGIPTATKLKRRPLTDEERFQRKINDFVTRDPNKDLQKRLDAFLQKSGG